MGATKVIRFEYKKGSSLPPKRIFKFFNRIHLKPEDGVNVDFELFPDLPWLVVSETTKTDAKIGLNDRVNQLSPGVYSETIRYNLIKTKVEDGVFKEISRYIVGAFVIKLVVIDTIFLKLSKNSLEIDKTKGIDISKDRINVESENEWTVSVNKPWVKLSKIKGENNGHFFVDIEDSGLGKGKYIAVIKVDDGVTVKIVTLKLNILVKDDSNYLYVNPLRLNFGYTITGVLPIVKRIGLNSSKPWSAISNKEWVKLSKRNGSSGPGVLDVGLQNLAGLKKGVYSAEIIIRCHNIIKRVVVTLNVYSFVEESLKEGRLYYTDDYDNFIKVSSGRKDTHLQIKVSSNYYKHSQVTYNLPFFKGMAQKRIGLEAKKMLRDLPLVKVGGDVALINPYKPIELGFVINETALFEDQNIQTIKQEGIRFIKGVSPSGKWLSDVSTTIFATREGVVQFSFLGPANEIKISGAVTGSYFYENKGSVFYTAQIPLKNFDLKDGDQITVKTGGVVVTVVVKPKDKEQTFIYWENQWGCFDVFECTGSFVESTSYKETSFDFRKDFKTIETKVINVQCRDKYKMNTGYIYSEKEVMALRGMLGSKNIYLVRQHSVISVKSTSKNLEVYKTRDSLRSFNLTFENKEQL